jgi:long-chain fatty acid transport protein
VSLENRGHADVDFTKQLSALDPSGNPILGSYSARTRTELPLTIGTGMSWKPNNRWSLGAWVDWHQWSHSYDTFGVDLFNGTNPTVNGAIGSNVSDRIPLNWRDRFTIALGAEYLLNEDWTLRGGWRYGKSPIPTKLVTPLNGAIFEHALTLGASWKRDQWTIDMGYACEFGPGASVGVSGYQAGEYSNSVFDLSVQHLGIGITRTF